MDDGVQARMQCPLVPAEHVVNDVLEALRLVLPAETWYSIFSTWLNGSAGNVIFT
jgi:hypothetical protein